MSTNSHIGEQHQIADSDEISLKELILKIREWWQYLWSRKLIIIGFGLLGGVLGFTYAYFQKPTYTATTTFVLESNEGGGGLGQYAGLASMVGIDLGGGGGGIFQGDNILELYKSRTMLEKTLMTSVEIDGKRQTLMERYIAMNNMREGWKEKPALLKLRFDSASNGQRPTTNDQRLRDSLMGTAVERIKKGLLSVTKPDKKLSIIQVDVKSGDEQFSKLFNDNIVATVNNFYLQTKTKKSAENVAILQGKVDSVRAVMNGAIYTAVVVNDATPNLNPTRQVKRVAPQQKAQFNAETNKQVLMALVQNLELANIAMRKDAPLLQKLDEPVYPLKKEKFGKLKGVCFGAVVVTFLAILILIFIRIKENILNN